MLGGEERLELMRIADIDKEAIANWDMENEAIEKEIMKKGEDFSTPTPIKFYPKIQENYVNPNKIFFFFLNKIFFFFLNKIFFFFLNKIFFFFLNKIFFFFLNKIFLLKYFLNNQEDSVNPNKIFFIF
jgi:hypothetical protein